MRTCSDLRQTSTSDFHRPVVPLSVLSAASVGRLCKAGCFQGQHHAAAGDHAHRLAGQAERYRDGRSLCQGDGAQRRPHHGRDRLDRSALYASGRDHRSCSGHCPRASSAFPSRTSWSVPRIPIPARRFSRRSKLPAIEPGRPVSDLAQSYRQVLVRKMADAVRDRPSEHAGRENRCGGGGGPGGPLQSPAGREGRAGEDDLHAAAGGRRDAED